MNEETKLWEDVGDKRAAEKVSQRLREKERGDEEGLLTNHEGLFDVQGIRKYCVCHCHTCVTCGYQKWLAEMNKHEKISMDRNGGM